MIDTTFTLSETEYLEAQKLYVRSATPNVTRNVRIIGAFVCFSFVYIALTNLHNLRIFLDPRILPAAFMLVLFLLMPALQRRAFRKRYRVEKPGLTNVHLEIDEESYRSKVPGQGQGVIPWTAFTSFGETENLFVLFKGFGFYAIPKRALSSAQISEAELLIHSRLPKLDRKLAKSEGR